MRVLKLHFFSHGVATAYSLGRKPQEFGTIRVLAPEGRQQIEPRSTRCRPSGAEFCFLLVFLGLTPQALCCRHSVAQIAVRILCEKNAGIALQVRMIVSKRFRRCQ